MNYESFNILESVQGNIDHTSVVGGTGFIGSRLLRELRIRKFQYTAFNRSHPPMFDSGHLDPLIIKANKIVWAASSINPTLKETHNMIAMQELEYWERFVKNLENLNPNGHLVFLSSGGCVYSGNKLPFNEDDEVKGTNPYGVVKRQMENILMNSKVNWTILRVSNVYGEQQPIGRGQGVIAEWLHALKVDKPLRLFGNPETFRDYIYVQDLIDCICLIDGENGRNEVFNVGSGVPTTLSEIYSKLNSLTKRNIDLVSEPSRSQDRLGYFLDTQKIYSKVHWRAKTDLDVGLRKMLSI